jgi:hypothetical protein
MDLEISLRWDRRRDGFDVSMRFDGSVDDILSADEPLSIDVHELQRLSADEPAYGAALTRMLLRPADTEPFYLRVRAMAEGDHRKLRVRLHLSAPAQFHAVRWESLRDPTTGTPIATQSDVLLSRYLTSPDLRPIPAVAGHDLRALVVVAGPRNLQDYRPNERELGEVNVEEELARAEAALDGISIRKLNGGAATLTSMLEALDEGVDILYLVCHGALIDDVPVLYLENPDRMVDPVDGRKFIERLSELQQRPRMVMLSSSQSARVGAETWSADDGDLSALAPRLAAVGVAAIVAMQGNVSMETASTFTPVLFAELANHGIVDEAMAAARSAIRERSEWWVPVLFMRLRSGRIWEPAVFPSRLSMQVAGYSADAILEQDQLGILHDVRTLAAVLASNRTMPPVSVGLFGDWGSGKSFFMRQLQLHIHELGTQSRYAEQAEPPEPSFFCSEVVQIEFNAWHYVDANLWASLVTRIFEGLSKHVGKQKGMSEAYQALLGELETARVLLKQTEERQHAAEAVLAQAKETRDVLNAERRSEADGRSVQDFVEQNPELSDAGDQLAKTLGIDQATLSLGQLRQVTDDLHHTVGRLRQGWNALDRTEGFWTKRRLGAVLAAAAVLAVLGLRWLVDSNTDVKGLVALIGSTITAVASVAASVIRTTNQALAAADRVVAKDEQEHKRQLANAQRRVEVAQQEVEEARKEVERIQQLDAGSVYRFIEDRYTSSDYRQHLGIVALIQRDFQSLSERLVPPNGPGQPKRGDGELPLPRIDRIMLYIDDLDRCPSDRVVQVLQAVHLLLAFPLFVVVVGVDSRWLLRSLRHEYSALLGSSAEDGFSEDEADYWASTPQNYLEKIFQIPFWIRPMEQRGYIQLIRSLIGSDIQVPDVGDPGLSPAENQVEAAGGGAEDATAPAGSLAPTNDSGRDGSAAGEQQLAAAPSAAVTEGLKADSASRDPAIDLTPSKLLITPDEQAFIEVLAPLIPTPRIAKRLINTYRLLRASSTDPDAFQGRTGPAQFQAVLLLLAIMNGFPSQAGVLFRELRQSSVSTWPKFVDDLRPLPLAPGAPDAPDTPDSNRPAVLQDVAPEFSSRLLGRMNQVEAIRWLRLCQSLDKIRPHLTPTSLSSFRAWAPRVARYSFEAGRMIEGGAPPDG